MERLFTQEHKVGDLVLSAHCPMGEKEIKYMLGTILEIYGFGMFYAIEWADGVYRRGYSNVDIKEYSEALRAYLRRT